MFHPFRRVAASLSHGGPLSRVWIAHVTFGGVLFGVLSLPSDGLALGLVPLFALAGVLSGAGCWRGSRRLVCAGVGVLIVAAWTRGLALWGTDQHGVGGNLIASFAWWWIAVALIWLLIAVAQRGVG